MGGHFGDATRMHPLWFVVLPIVAGLVAIELAAYVRSGAWGTTARVTQRRDVRLLMHVTLAAVMLLWIARFLGAFGGPVAALERF